MTVTMYRAAVIVLLLTVAALAGILLKHHDAAATTPSSSTTVSSFNQGFSDSKLDDCQQGSAYACAWLHAAN